MVAIWFQHGTALDFVAECADTLHAAVTSASAAERMATTGALKWAWRPLVSRMATSPLRHQQMQQRRAARLLDLIDDHLGTVAQTPLSRAVAERVAGIRYQFAAVARTIVSELPRWPYGDVLNVAMPLLLVAPPITTAPDGTISIAVQPSAA
jgi:hypothetical protein